MKDCSWLFYCEDYWTQVNRFRVNLPVSCFLLFTSSWALNRAEVPWSWLDLWGGLRVTDKKKHNKVQFKPRMFIFCSSEWCRGFMKTKEREREREREMIESYRGNPEVCGFWIWKTGFQSCSKSSCRPSLWRWVEADMFLRPYSKCFDWMRFSRYTKESN